MYTVRTRKIHKFDIFTQHQYAIINYIIPILNYFKNSQNPKRETKKGWTAWQDPYTQKSPPK